MLFKIIDSVRDCEESNILLSAVSVQSVFNISTNSTCAFIENSEFRVVIEHSSHSNSLLFTTRELVIPVFEGFESIGFSVNNVF